jgi:hypothetical protein
MKSVFDKFKEIKLDEHQSKTLEKAASSFATKSSSFLSESEIVV